MPSITPAKSFTDEDLHFSFEKRFNGKTLAFPEVQATKPLFCDGRYIRGDMLTNHHWDVHGSRWAPSPVRNGVITLSITGRGPTLL